MATNQSPKTLSKKHLARLEKERRQNRYIMGGSLAVLVIVVLLVVYGILDQTVLHDLKPVAKVGNETISTKAFQVQVEYSRYQLIQRYDQTAQIAQLFGSDSANSSYFTNTLQTIQSQLADTQTLGQTVLTQMIDDKIIRQEAAKRGITVTDAEVDKAMQDAFGFFPNGTPTPTITPTSFSTPTLSATQLALVTITPTPTTAPTDTPTISPTLAATAPASTPTSAPTITPTSAPTATSTPYTLQGYQTSVKSYLDSVKTLGFKDTDLRQLFFSQLYREKLRADITKDLKPEREEVWARHILLPDEASAEAVIARLNKGEDFGKVAEEVSTDTASKVNGGDLGWFYKGQMYTEFETAAFSMKIGEISSKPVKTTAGYHVIQVLGHENRSLTATDFETYKDSTLQDWLTTQEKAATIVKYDTVWKANVPTVPELSTSGTGSAAGAAQ